MTQPSPTGPPNEHAEARGFAVYIGLDEYHALADGTTLGEMAAALKELVQTIAPSAQTYTSIAVAPRDSGGRDLDVVKNSTSRPDLAAARGPGDGNGTDARSGAKNVVIDLSRRRMLIGPQVRLLTYMEFELLQYLVEHEGTTVTRQELIEVLWSGELADQMSSRTVDVHVRRLRVKLGSEADLVRTVHGLGYVFNKGWNVQVVYRGQS
ncbi:winged helix-turn-helix domain-containing protein [Subtercola lobariae]|uniref:OmpR/PhoB-type domain-containing protein n=1 Tax=Subtercola lobariae TaxID=1588641 RepID=A0A917EVT8_9MICO|nr:winged helix-turn-helix domain-containing protein [Subtercola lobariae]GGF21882.1 hypothetical protein GCM10011399_14510 [Subtercola lobariae]